MPAIQCGQCGGVVTGRTTDTVGRSRAMIPRLRQVVGVLNAAASVVMVMFLAAGALGPDLHRLSHALEESPSTEDCSLAGDAHYENDWPPPDHVECTLCSRVQIGPPEEPLAKVLTDEGAVVAAFVSENAPDRRLQIDRNRGPPALM